MILAASFGLPYWPDKLGELGQLLSPTVFTYEDLQKPIVYEQWAFVRVMYGVDFKKNKQGDCWELVFGLTYFFSNAKYPKQVKNLVAMLVAILLQL